MPPSLSHYNCAAEYTRPWGVSMCLYRLVYVEDLVMEVLHYELFAAVYYQGFRMARQHWGTFFSQSFILTPLLVWIPSPEQTGTTVQLRKPAVGEAVLLTRETILTGAPHLFRNVNKQNKETMNLN